MTRGLCCILMSLDAHPTLGTRGKVRGRVLVYMRGLHGAMTGSLNPRSIMSLADQDAHVNWQSLDAVTLRCAMALNVLL